MRLHGIPDGVLQCGVQNRAAPPSPTYFPTQAPEMGPGCGLPIAGSGEPAYANTQLPEVVTVPRDRMPDPVTKTTSAKPVDEQPPGVLRLDDSQTITLKHDHPAPRRSFADITAKPGYAPCAGLQLDCRGVAVLALAEGLATSLRIR